MDETLERLKAAVVALRRAKAPEGEDLAAVLSLIAGLREALGRAGQWFRDYEQLHAAKPDLTKAKVNADRAAFCEAAALSTTRSEPDWKAEAARLREALGGLVKLYEDDEGCASLPQVIGALRALGKGE